MFISSAVLSEERKEYAGDILDDRSVGILSGRALVSLRFSPGGPVGEPFKYCLIGIVWHVRFHPRCGTPTFPFTPPTSEVKVPSTEFR
jgi:hypothetical protein